MPPLRAVSSAAERLLGSRPFGPDRIASASGWLEGVSAGHALTDGFAFDIRSVGRRKLRRCGMDFETKSLHYPVAYIQSVVRRQPSPPLYPFSPDPGQTALPVCVFCPSHPSSSSHGRHLEMPLLRAASSAAVAAAMLPMRAASSAAERLLGCLPSCPRLRLIHPLTAGINVALALTTPQPGLHTGEGSDKERVDSGGRQGVWTTKERGTQSAPRTKPRYRAGPGHVLPTGEFLSVPTQKAWTQSQSDDSSVWMGSGLNKDDVQLGSGFDKADL
ncbi:hypothetical protein K438DRAFT_1787246 [Mycena galopus ATCC 62051]|nr:hypothetical protein K438DRAFT_1787246 [Mycena galopus ATCC 62051]